MYIPRRLSIQAYVWAQLYQNYHHQLSQKHWAFDHAEFYYDVLDSTKKRQAWRSIEIANNLGNFKLNGQKDIHHVYQNDHADKPIATKDLWNYVLHNSVNKLGIQPIIEVLIIFDTNQTNPKLNLNHHFNAAYFKNELLENSAQRDAWQLLCYWIPLNELDLVSQKPHTMLISQYCYQTMMQQLTLLTGPQFQTVIAPNK